ncbi:MAG: hypothetical protein KGS72_27995 [Cyanobacteria bacterium REEB67]|nr:hypothetical protein [Cyanobacteria bacterium REEB67]
MNKLPSFLSASLCLSLGLALVAPLFCLAAGNKSGWIDSDQDEIKLPVQRQSAPEQWRNSTNNNDGGENDEAQPSGRQRRGYQAAEGDAVGNGPMSGSAAGTMTNNGGAPQEGAVDAAGNPLNLDDLDSRPVQTPKLTIHEGGSHVISGGVTSANFRSGNTLNRGTDARAASLLQSAPFLTPPRTIAIQPSSFKAFLDQNHSAEVAGLAKTTIVEIKGQWDDCGHTLRNYGLPFTKISPNAIARADLSRSKILVVNCGANFDADSLERIRDFVAHGGFLMTTDWALDSCLQKAFPGYVEWNGAYTDNSVVDAVVVDRDPDLIKGVPRVGFWKLEDKSQTVQVIRKLEVQVLVRSRQLMGREPSELGILALTFPYGDGQILHLVGHFDNNADRAFNNALPDPAPSITIALRQAIAANFIMAAAREGIGSEAPAAKAGSKRD